MTSVHQRVANRANAAKSTGPRTPEGKAIVRANAMTHGLTATTVLMEGEDDATFETFRLAFWEDLAPDSMMEMELADHLIQLLWRARRIAGFEAAILTWMEHWSGEYFDVDGYAKEMNGKHERVQRYHKGLTKPDKSRSERHHRHLVVGRMLHEQMNNNLITKLSRYEGHILAQLKSVHAQFLKEQARRLEREAAISVIPPADPKAQVTVP